MLHRNFFLLLGYAILVGVCAILAWVVHQDAQDGTWRYRQIYPVQAWLARHNTQCRGAQLQWTKQALNTARRQAGSLASALVFWPGQGVPTECASAPWGQKPQPQARYRYASITKLFTAQAVVNAMAQARLPLATPLAHFLPVINQAQDSRWQQIRISQSANNA